MAGPAAAKDDPYAEFGVAPEAPGTTTDPYGSFKPAGSPSSAGTGAVPPPTDKPGLLDKEIPLTSHMAATEYGLQNIGRGLRDFGKGVVSTLDPRPHGSEEEAAAGASSYGRAVLPVMRTLRGFGETGKQATQVPAAIHDINQSQDPLGEYGDVAARTAGEGAGQAIGGIATEIAGKLPKLKDYGVANPHESIPAALHTPAKSPRMTSTITDVEGSRPYLSGVKSQAELQNRIPAVKAEVWKPYNDAMTVIKDRPVVSNGSAVLKPDGTPMTYGDLETERLEVSAKLQDSKKPPAARKTELQKNETTASLQDRLDQIHSQLDPELSSTGIKPEDIRRVHGNIKGIERKVSGKNTVAEPEQPYGFKKMIPQQVPTPLGKTWSWSPIEGYKDLRNGRPAWSGIPTDVRTEELFRGGAPKPDLGRMNIPPTRGLLGEGPTQLGSSMEPLGQPSTPPPVADTTRAQRMNLLLPEKAGISKPIQVGSSAEALYEPSMPPPTLDYHPSMQQPPAFVKPGQIKPAPVEPSLIPNEPVAPTPKGVPRQQRMFDLEHPYGGPKTPEPGVAPKMSTEPHEPAPTSRKLGDTAERRDAGNRSTRERIDTLKMHEKAARASGDTKLADQWKEMANDLQTSSRQAPAAGEGKVWRDAENEKHPVTIQYDEYGQPTANSDGRHRAIQAFKQGYDRIEVNVDRGHGPVKTTVPVKTFMKQMGVTPESLEATDAQQSYRAGKGQPRAVAAK